MDDRRYQISYLFKKRKLERSVKMNNLQVFKSEEFGEVRSLLINNKPWFIGK